MKTFSSSILSVNKNSSNPIALKNIKENQSDLIRLLEFNEDIAKADITCTRDYYLGLLKFANKEVSNFDPAYAAIFNQYDAVANTVKTMLSACNATPLNWPRENEKIVSELAEKIRTSNRSDMVKLYGIAKSPIGADTTTILYPIRDYCSKVIENIKSGNFNGTPELDMVQVVCQHVSKANGLEPANSIDEYCDNYSNYFEFRDVDVLPSNISSVIYNCMDCCGNIYMNASDIDAYGLCETTISLLKVNIDKFEDPNVIRMIVKNICDALSTYAILICKSREICDKKRMIACDVNTERLAQFVLANKSLRESMSMFGDEIDSETMFATLDPEDFNPTMFMDLNLVSENYYNLAKMDAVKQSMALEAKLLAEGKYDELYTVQEAMAGKIKDVIGKIVEAVKQMLDKFVADIMGVFASEKAYLTKYKNIILNNTFPDNTDITFYGDVINGYNRLKKTFKIPTINYNELEKSAFEGDNPEAVFFDAYFIKKGFIGSDFKRNTEKSLADDLKLYWGFKDDQTHAHKMSELPKIDEIYNWLLATEKEAKQLTIEAKNIERSYQNYVRSAKNFAKKEEQNPTTPQKESYYSPLFQKWMTIDEAIVRTQPSSNTQQSGTSQQNQADDRTRVKTTQGDTDAQVKQSNDTEQKIVKNMEIYCKVCRQVCSARATAFRYVHKEFMDIIRAIVKAKLGNSADIKYTENKSPADGQQQPAQTQK